MAGKKQLIEYQKIFTPQGMLGDVSKKPNLDFLMNIFNIPRIYSVSGFGSWNVGQHTLATAFLSLYWAKLNNYPSEKRDRLVTLALLHDAHEAVVGDILPYFKTDEVRVAVDAIQHDINSSFGIVDDKTLKEELKLMDLISFLYEISQSSVSGMNPTKQKLLKNMYDQQKETIMNYVEKVVLEKSIVKKFLKEMDL